MQARIRLKTGRVINLLLSTDHEVEGVIQSIDLLSMIEPKDCFPFSYIAPGAYEKLHDVVVNTTDKWFKTLRQKRWRLYDGNRAFGVCATYPAHVVVPDSCRDDIIMKAAQFRDGARFPILSCLAGNTHNPLMRSSSIGYGLGADGRSAHDEEIMKRISNGQKGVIIDIRPNAIVREL